MRERAKQFEIAVPALDRSFGDVWRASSRSPWVKGAPLLLIVLLVVSAAVLSIHAYYNLQQILRDRHLVNPLEPLAVRCGFREGCDV
jgi:hypothetical protein